MRLYLLFAVLSFAVFSLGSASYVGNASIFAPAVLLSNNTGTLTTINLTVTTGTGLVSINGPQHVGNSTLQSAKEAAAYASSYLHLNESHYNFNYLVKDNSSSVSGPSAGAAMTILAVSALSGKPLLHNFTMTGTIEPNGNIGQIGGIYDKAGAAFNKGLSFVLVPRVSNSSTEDIIYLITQDNFGLPLVQVSNISQASEFAFGKKGALGYETKYNFSLNYSLDKIPNATLVCTGPCSVPFFKRIQNLTLNLSNHAISNLSSQTGFSTVAHQLSGLNSEGALLGRKGYLYEAADREFLDYIEAYTFLAHSTNINKTFGALNVTGSYCSGLISPQLTNQNYPYIIGGELRQSWANLTLNGTIPSNLSQIDTDTLLRMSSNIGESYAWCKGSSLMYAAAAGIGGLPVVYSSAVSNLAASRINRALPYPGLYLSSAKQLYGNGKYGAAIYAADYAYADGKAAKEANATASTLRSMAISIADNSTYGIWGTQFSDEALFYVNESSLAHNFNISYSYAFSAYQTAILANQLSNDTRSIGAGLNLTTSSTTIPQNVTTLPGSSYGTILAIASAAILLSILSLIISLGTLLRGRGAPKPKGINRVRRKR